MTMQTYVHFTSENALGKIKSSKKIVALTESRVYFSKNTRSHSISSSKKYSITVSGNLYISRHPFLIIPSIWGLYKWNQYVSPIGYDIKLSNINYQNPLHLTADGALERSPLKRRIFGGIRRVYRYFFIDILLTYGALLFFSANIFYGFNNIAIIYYWIVTIILFGIVGSLWSLVQYRVNDWLLK